MRLLGLITLHLIFVLPAFSETPEEVVSAYCDEVKSEGFSKIARLIHPDEIAQFRKTLEPVVADALLSEESDDFRAFASLEDSTKMATMTDIEFANLFMTWASNAMPGLRQMMREAKLETLGHIVEGDLYHVIVRLEATVNGVTIKKMSVMTAKEHDGKMMMTLSFEMKGVAESLQRRREGQ